MECGRENPGLSDIKSWSQFIESSRRTQSPCHVGSMTKSIDVLRALRRMAVTSIRETSHTRPLGTSTANILARQSRRYSTHPSKPPKQGQPLHSSHPHLINSKHLTKGIPASEYEERRRKLMENLGEGAVVICMGNTVRLVTQRMFPF